VRGLAATRYLALALLILAPPWPGCSSTTPTDDNADDPSLPSCSASDARQCGDALASAQELLDTHAACSAGDSCNVVSEPSLGIPCSMNVLFYCPFAVNARTDVSAFVARATELSAAAHVCLGCRSACAIPSCVPPGSVSATCNSAGRCVLQTR
jgi:hypothetical protein